MKRVFLVGCLLLCGFLGEAQDWKTVGAGAPAYFMASKHGYHRGVFYHPQSPRPATDSMLRMMRIDGYTSSGGDTVFRFFTSLRDTAYKGFGGTSQCVDTVAPSWLGPLLLRKGDDTEHYLNSYGDTITIKTKAALNDTWLLARDRSGLSFFARVSAVGIANIDGVPDSVKDISITAMSGASAVPHYYNAFTLRMSKANGWIAVLDFYRFPNLIRGRDDGGIAVDSGLHIRLSQKGIPGGMLVNAGWKYTPGNEWIWKWERGYEYGNPDKRPTATTIRFDSVESYQSLGPGVGLATVRTVEYNESHVYKNNQNFQGYVDANSTVSYTTNHTVRDTAFTAGLTPEAGWKASLASRHFVGRYDTGRYFITRALLSDYRFDYSTGCLRLSYYLRDADYARFETWLPEFGQTGQYIDEYGSSPQATRSEYRRHIYIKTGPTTFGTKINMRMLAVGKQPAESVFSAAPNPANNRIVITGVTPAAASTATLFSLDGRAMKRVSFTGGNAAIETADVPAGLYLLTIKCGSSTQHIKVMIQH